MPRAPAPDPIVDCEDARAREQLMPNHHFSPSVRAFLSRVGIKHPIVQAPMAGGATTPELIAAVSEAGALGSLGAAATAPAKILDDVAAIRQRTARPFNVNLFVLEEPRADDARIRAQMQRAAELIAPI